MLSLEDHQAIKAKVQLYFDGCYYANVTQIREAFHPNCIIAGSFKGQYVEWSLDQFIQRIEEAKSYQHEPFLKEIVSLEGMNNIAMVKTQVFAGGNAFTDYIALVKIDGVWWIRYKSFTCE